jgi:hypothetical protein
VGAPSGERSFPLGESKVPPLESHHGYSVVNTLFPHNEAPTHKECGLSAAGPGWCFRYIRYTRARLGMGRVLGSKCDP